MHWPAGLFGYNGMLCRLAMATVHHEQWDLYLVPFVVFNIWMLQLTYLCLLIVPFYFLWCSISQVALMSKDVLSVAL